MVGDKKRLKELFPYLDLPRIPGREPVADTIAMSIEFLEFQGEVAYEVGKRQAISITSTASTVGIGWSAFFFGLIQESWLTSSVGLMMVFAGSFFLAYWTPKVLDKMRDSLDELGAAKFYSKWLSGPPRTEVTEKGQ